ncbi:hypothetical protein [Pseudomonas sp. UMAB-40]|uniref:hypothetical protein n=1 Tax=Pseudomonas sp. UMAB-40 TaxID=1365407 RepID=UPI001C55B635|nr:hypothetical protein [Pseudomonas sp. UMAB-40]
MAPHELALADFQNQATVEALVNHGRKWIVTFGPDFHSFSDAESADAALVDVHHAACNNAIYFNGPDAPDFGALPSMPTTRVLKDHPDLFVQAATFQVSCANGSVLKVVGLENAFRAARQHMYFTEREWAEARKTILGGAKGCLIAYGFAQTGIDLVQADDGESVVTP